MTRVLLLRPRAECEPLSFLLEDEGLEPAHLPLLALDWSAQSQALRAAAEQVARYRWIAADAPQAVQALGEAVARAGTRAALRQAQWLAPSEATARAITRQGWLPRLVQPGEPCQHPDHSHSHLHQHSQWGVITPLLEAEDEVLVVHEVARVPSWAQALREGRAAVSCVAAWQPAPAADLGPRPHAVVVESALEGELLLERSPELREAPFVAVGEASARALEALGVRAVELVRRAGADAVLEAVLLALAHPRP